MKELIITHIDISPGKEKKCCENCYYFSKYGVHLGYCVKKEKDMLDKQSCKLFKKDID